MAVTEFLSFMTAASWIADLAKKYAKERGERDEREDKLANVFGDPAVLARFYVPPDCSIENPADRDEDDDMRRPQPEPLFAVLEDFFERDINTTVSRISRVTDRSHSGFRQAMQEDLAAAAPLEAIGGH